MRGGWGRVLHATVTTQTSARTRRSAAEGRRRRPATASLTRPAPTPGRPRRSRRLPRRRTRPRAHPQRVRRGAGRSVDPAPKERSHLLASLHARKMSAVTGTSRCASRDGYSTRDLQSGGGGNSGGWRIGLVSSPSHWASMQHEPLPSNPEVESSNYHCSPIAHFHLRLRANLVLLPSPVLGIGQAHHLTLPQSQ